MVMHPRRRQPCSGSTNGRVFSGEPQGTCGSPASFAPCTPWLRGGFSIIQTGLGPSTQTGSDERVQCPRA
jgi:hypothetical protein